MENAVWTEAESNYVFRLTQKDPTLQDKVRMTKEASLSFQQLIELIDLWEYEDVRIWMLKHFKKSYEQVLFDLMDLPDRDNLPGYNKIPDEWREPRNLAENLICKKNCKAMIKKLEIEIEYREGLIEGGDKNREYETLRFKKGDKEWYISVAGNEITIPKDRIGLNYIHEIIYKNMIEPIKLYNVFHYVGEGLPKANFQDISDEKSDTLSFIEDPTADKVIDEMGEKLLLNKIDEIKKQMKNASGPVKIRLKKEYREIQSWKNKMTYGGKIKKLKDEYEKAQRNVYKRIKDTFNYLIGLDQIIGKYFIETIKYDPLTKMFRYYPKMSSIEIKYRDI